MSSLARVLLLAFAAAALGGGGAPMLAAAEVSRPQDALLAAHLAQAEALKPAPVRPGWDAAYLNLKAEIEKHRAAWDGKLERKLGAAELEAAIPSACLEAVRKAAADDTQTRELLKQGVGLQLVLALAAERNPEVRAAWEGWRASLRRFQQASYLEDLLTQYRAYVRELDTRVGPQTHREMPSLTFPFPSALALKGQVIDAEAEGARLNYLLMQRKVLNETARMYQEATFASRSALLVKGDRALVAEMTDLARNKLRSGETDRAEVLKAETMLAMLDAKLTTLARRQANIVGQLNAQLGLPVDAPWGRMLEAELGRVDWKLEDVLQQARASSHELLAAANDAELMALMVRMAETMVLPRDWVGYSQLALSAGAEAGPTRSMMAAFPERLVLAPRASDFTPDVAYLDELRVRAQQARDMLAAARARTESAARDAHFRLAAARRERKAESESAVPKARQTSDAQRDRYAAGTGSFADFLDAARNLVDVKVQQEQMRLDEDMAWLTLLDAMGLSVGARTSAEWSCARHPYLTSSQPGTCPVCGVELSRRESAPPAGTEGRAP